MFRLRLKQKFEVNVFINDFIFKDGLGSFAFT